MADNRIDVLLVGGGVMSATLGVLLKELDPGLRIVMLEKQDRVASESSDGWNNAGTGHAGYCELNYTPQKPDGSVEIERALAINASFETSLQFWSYLVEQQAFPASRSFINPTPHLSLVWGEKDVDFLRRRHEKLSAHPLFRDMEYSEDPARLAQWMPLALPGRASRQPLAATRVAYGTDVDFGSLTRSLVAQLERHPSFSLRLHHAVRGLEQLANGRWRVEVDAAGTKQTLEAGFVFLGAGGGALPLLQKSTIPESAGYGGFPVSGQWLVCRNPEVVARHHAKVYGKAPLGAPPMSVPHLDTRIIAGQPALLFGPFAGFTTKFQKQGSYLDLFASIRPGNLRSMLSAGRSNLDLTRYLIGEVFQSHEERIEALRNFYPQANSTDWTLAFAGKRVQIIKHGKLEFGTEIVAAKDGSIAALLGASPGASISVPAMIQVLEKGFGQRLAEPAWREKMQRMVPSYGQSLIEDAALLEQVRSRTLATLELPRH